MSRAINGLLLAGLISFSVFANQHALTNQSSPLEIPNLSGGIKIDGELDEEQWQHAKVLSLNFVTRPSENTKPPVNTQVRVFENSDTLFIAFKAADPDISEIRGFYRDRDQIWSDDLVGLKLDTFNDNRLAHQFFVNPLGIQADSIQNEMTGRESDSWDGIWQSAGKIVDDGYQVEIAIPLRILNFKEGQKNKIWGAEFVRFYPRAERIRISNQPHDRNNSCDLCQLGEINGFEDAIQGKNLALVPTLVLGSGRSRDLEESLEWEDSDNQDMGLDVKWGITPEISLQATLNPDFSQVESDVAQLSINNTFALFFNEKRPFFLENKDYFSSNYNLVYTRNIGSPDYGAKVTGRVDNHTFGLFVANDENTTFLVPGNIGSSVAQIEEESINVALRYRYDFSDDLSVGWTSTLRDAQGYHNYAYGVDAKYLLSPQDSIRVQVLNSDTEYPDELFKDFCDDGECATDESFSEAALRLQKPDNFSGSAFRVSYDHEQRNWWVRALSQTRKEGFRTDLGFGSRADHKQSVLGGGYRWYSENNWWNQIRLSGDWDIAHNDNGELIEKEAEVSLSMRGQFQSYFEVGVLDRDRVGQRENAKNIAISNNTTLFNEQQVKFFFEVRPIAQVYLNTFMRFGDEIDFDNNRMGKLTHIRPIINWSIGKHLQLRLRQTYSNLDVAGEQLFTANLTDFRTTYQFDQRQLLRLILVYSDIERNQDNYTFDVDAQNRSLGAQLLYSYKINPLTKFFVGYSDSAYEDDSLSALTKNQRSIFMKLSYAWLI
ncbi:MAG: hypothetical protein ACI88A_002453 [Paraglaciecola sp.]|jgi:hypothetical protein